MKSPAFRPWGNRRGIALISVLAVMILLTVLIVAFLLRAQIARNSSASYRATTATRLLSETVVNLVEASINDATTYGTSSAATTGGGVAPYTWASQPGAIRVYDSSGSGSGATLDLQMIYRLYSAPSLTTPNITDLLDSSGNSAELTAATNWASSPAVWVDLNAPVTVSDPVAGSFTVYPILDNRDPAQLAKSPSVDKAVQLPGFYVNPIGTSTFPTTLAGANLANRNPPVMPVQWLYVLQNGAIVAPDAGGGTTVTFTKVNPATNIPSSSNPIVGRIAYWTDDDTCKVNINTAAGSVSFRQDSNPDNITVNDGTTAATGIFFKPAGLTYGVGAYAGASWDTPRFGGSWEDIKLFAADQPVAGEYQRYPGHPATTILYYILYALGVNLPEASNGAAAGENPYALAWDGGSPLGKSADTQHGGNAVWQNTSSLFGLLPRYNDNGGSQGGLCDTTHTNTPIAPSSNRSRLYTSLGELLYATNASSATPPVRTQNGSMSTGSPVTASTTPVAPYLTRQQIETGKFFLTAHSRAPEVTLFGTPRVAIWPIPDTGPTPTQGTPMAITALDELITFCSTTDTGNSQAGNAYYFKRYDSTDTLSANTLTSNDWTNESRNQSVYGYLQDLTGSSGNIPGYGATGFTGSFLTKYSGSNYKGATPSIANERDQILTEIVDYIRCTNLNDHSWPNSTPPAGKANFASKGEVMPLQVTTAGGSSSRTASTTQGLGRLATLSEIGLHIICTADGTNHLAGVNGSNSNTGWVSTNISGSSVIYTTPVIVVSVSATIPVSPVIGSASDPAYVSNLPVAQFLRDTGNNIVDIYGNTVAAYNSAVNAPFPPNPTLSNTGLYPTTGLNTTTLTPLPVGSKMLQAMLIFEPAVPMKGWDLMTRSGPNAPDFNLLVSGSHAITIAGQQPFPSGTPATSGAGSNGDGYFIGTASTDTSWGGGQSTQGGIFGFRTGIASGSRYNGWSGQGPLASVSASNPSTVGTLIVGDTLGGPPSTVPWNGVSPNPYTPATQFAAAAGAGQPYRFVSNPFIVTTSTIQVGGSGSFTATMTLPVTNSTPLQVPYQTYTVAFPAVTLNSPTLVAYAFEGRNNIGNQGDYLITHAPDWWGFDNRIGWCSASFPSYAAEDTDSSPPGTNLGPSCVIRGDQAPPAAGWGTTANPWSWSTTFTTNLGTSSRPPVPLASTTTSYGDVVRSIVPKDCDYRVTMARVGSSANPINANPPTTASSNTSDFMVTPQYANTAIPIDNMFQEPQGSNGTAGTETSGALINLVVSSTAIVQASNLAPKAPYIYSYAPTTVPGTASTPQSSCGWLSSWDWDNGSLNEADGAYSNKPDEGVADSAGGTGQLPYVNANAGNNNGTQVPSYFTANRMIASAVSFGSLPTGVAEGIPWRNLLFRPQLNTSQDPKALRTGGAAGTAVSSPAGPEDELLLDNFWMPVVQPYAISEPFSTAGKINMNSQILPFTYITRNTGLMAVLGSELIARVPAIAAGPGGSQSSGASGGGNQTDGTTQNGLKASATGLEATVSGVAKALPARLPLNLSATNGTLRQFTAKFASGDIFRSPAEICDIYLVPIDAVNPTYYTDWFTSTSTPPYANADYAQADSWYGTRGDFAMVGNNTRDRPYNDIYPRLTTKSNTFTVYYKVQSLKNPPSAAQNQWTEGTGVVTGEYRGSTSIERYLDPNNNNIPDFAVSGNNPAVTAGVNSLDNYYQWRVVSNTAFAP